jgi:hypothetical protein
LYLGTNWRDVAGIAHYLLIGSVAAILIIFVFLFFRRKKGKPKAQTPC